MNPHERTIIASTSVAHFCAHFFTLLFPALVMPLSREFALSPERVIAISFPMYLCYGILALPWGLLSDLVQPRLVMGAGILLAGASLIGAGLCRSTGGLTFWFALLGAGCAAYHPSGLALLSTGVRQRGRALGINGVCGNLGIASAPLAAGLLCYLVDWQTALVSLGVTGVVAGFALACIPMGAARNRDLHVPAAAQPGRAALLFIVLCGAMLFSGLLYRGFTVILPTLLEAHLSAVSAGLQEKLAFLLGPALPAQFSTLVATTAASIAYLTGMTGQLLGGRVADRFDLRWGYLGFFCCALPFLGLLSTGSGLYLVVPAGMVVFFTLGMQPIENSLVAMLTPERWRSVGYGIKFVIVFGAGSLSVTLVSLVQGTYGLDRVVLLLAGYLIMVVLLVCVLIMLSRGMGLRNEKDQ
jgi:MFS family permease